MPASGEAVFNQPLLIPSQELPEADQTQAASEQLEVSKDEIRPPSPQIRRSDSRVKVLHEAPRQAKHACLN